jgi:hypothetical protein
MPGCGDTTTTCLNVIVANTSTVSRVSLVEVTRLDTNAYTCHHIVCNIRIAVVVN